MSVRKARRRRVDRLEGLISPTVRFFWGLFLLGCLVFAGGWIPRGLLMLLGLSLAYLAGKRVSLGYFSFLIATVVVFHLFLPLGKVWLRLGSWPVTEGAFLLGVGKGFTFAGLVFFSLGAIHRRLRLPGVLGQVWAQTFSWYEQLMEQRAAIKPRALLLSIDRLLERLYPTRNSPAVPAAESSQDHPSETTTRQGWIVVVATSVVALAVSGGWR